MRLTPNFILILFITSIVLYSCKDNSHSSKLLNQAQNLLESAPDKALIYLDSINEPQALDKDSYMKYLVIYTGAKQEIKADISADTLIFKAQKYFEEKGNSKYLALANYYAGCVYYSNNILPESLESFMNAANESMKTENTLLIGNSLNNIGYIYFEQDLFDSAIVNYQKSLSYYDKIDKTGTKKIKVYLNIGSAYEAAEKLDSACFYYQKGLALAQTTGNKLAESQFNQNLGITCYGQAEYEKAVEYLRSALNMDITNEAQKRKIYLYLLNIYNKREEPHLAKEYADLVTESLPNVTYKYTIKEIYGALAEYYKQSGDYKQALAYSELEKTTKEQIEKESNAPALLSADKNFHLTQKDREIQEFRSDIYLLLVVGGVIICVILVFIFFVWNDNKRGKAEIRECAERYDEIKALLFAMGDKYPKIEAEIKSMLEND